MVVSTGGGDCCCSGSEARIGECRLRSRHSGGSSHPPIPPAGPTRLIPPGFRVIRSTSTSSTFPPTPVSPFVCVVCGFEFFGPYDSSLPAARCDSAAPRACKSALSSGTRCWGISCLCVCVCVFVCVCVCVCVWCVRSISPGCGAFGNGVQRARTSSNLGPVACPDQRGGDYNVPLPRARR